jgi:hypothetical protein
VAGYPELRVDLSRPDRVIAAGFDGDHGVAVRDDRDAGCDGVCDRAGIGGALNVDVVGDDPPPHRPARSLCRFAANGYALSDRVRVRAILDNQGGDITVPAIPKPQCRVDTEAAVFTPWPELLEDLTVEAIER